MWKRKDKLGGGGGGSPPPPSTSENTRSEMKPSGILKSRLRHSQSAPVLTALHHQHHDDDHVMEEGEEYTMPLQDEPSAKPSAEGSGMRRAVSFSNLAQPEVKHYDSSLPEHVKAQLFFGSDDIRGFAQEEIARRRDLGIASTSMLCSTVPAFDEDDEHEEQGVHLMDSSMQHDDDDDDDMAPSF